MKILKILAIIVVFVFGCHQTADKRQNDIKSEEKQSDQMTPEQKFEKEQKAKGLVKYQDQWMTPEQKLEKEQKSKEEKIVAYEHDHKADDKRQNDKKLKSEESKAIR